MNPWSAFPIVLASSHLARRRSRRQEILDAGPWDVVLVDEAHHARRRGSKSTDTPNSLLALLLDMREREMWRALYLATATPMQMNPHEAWDLISLLGLQGKWGEAAFYFLQYFEQLRYDPKVRIWQFLCNMLSDYFADPTAERDRLLEQDVEEELGWVRSYAVTSLADNIPSSDAQALMPDETSKWMDKWLRRHTPMRDRVFRNTRKSMREYQAAGIIDEDVTIPVRHVDDAFIDLAVAERKLYDRIEDYIRRHYNAYKSDQSSQALGFIMTIYRRRLTSSFEAIKKSLHRRLDVLEQGKSLGDLLSDDDNIDIEDSLFDPEAFDMSADRLKDEIHELRLFINELNKITGEDTKATRLVADVNTALLKYSSPLSCSLNTPTPWTTFVDVSSRRASKRLAATPGAAARFSATSTRRGRWSPRRKSRPKFRNGELDRPHRHRLHERGPQPANLGSTHQLRHAMEPHARRTTDWTRGPHRRDLQGHRSHELLLQRHRRAACLRGHREDYGDFTDIVGDAAPVLANIEKVIEQLALAANLSDEVIASEIAGIRTQIDDINNQSVSTDDLGTPDDDITIKTPPDLVGDITPSDLATKLTNNLLSGRWLTPDDGRPGIYSLFLPRGDARVSFGRPAGATSVECYLGQPSTASVPVTFDRDIWDTSSDSDLVFLTYGSPELASLLPAEPGEEPSW